MSIENKPQLPTNPDGSIAPLYGESPFTVKRIVKGGEIISYTTLAATLPGFIESMASNSIDGMKAWFISLLVSEIVSSGFMMNRLALDSNAEDGKGHIYWQHR